MENLENLIERINEFLENFDFYNYVDNQYSLESLKEEISTMLINGRLFGVRTFFNDIVEQEEGTEAQQLRALKLVREIEALEAIQRYKWLYYKEKAFGGDYLHHLHECSYHLINFFGLKDADLRALERELEQEEKED